MLNHNNFSALHSLCSYYAAAIFLFIFLKCLKLYLITAWKKYLKNPLLLSFFALCFVLNLWMNIIFLYSVVCTMYCKVHTTHPLSAKLFHVFFLFLIRFVCLKIIYYYYCCYSGFFQRLFLNSEFQQTNKKQVVCSDLSVILTFFFLFF